MGKALPPLVPLAEGDMDPLQILGLAYEDGDGTAPDARKSVHWLKLASAHGDSLSKAYLVNAYADGAWRRTKRRPWNRWKKRSRTASPWRRFFWACAIPQAMALRRTMAGPSSHGSKRPGRMESMPPASWPRPLRRATQCCTCAPGCGSRRLALPPLHSARLQRQLRCLLEMLLQQGRGARHVARQRGFDDGRVLGRDVAVRGSGGSRRQA